jgi:hypothetical protein
LHAATDAFLQEYAALNHRNERVTFCDAASSRFWESLPVWKP